MSAHTVALALILGAAILAAWIDARAPWLTPGSFTAVGLHLICSIVTVELGMRVLGAAAGDAPMTVLAALFTAALPATVYMILSAFWVIKLLHGLVDRAVR